MSHTARLATGYGPILVLCLLLVATPLPAHAEEETGDPEPCCLINKRYTGICEAFPREGETCKDILAYLNNMRSVGRTVCGNTKVREGWELVSCDPAEREQEESEGESED